MEASWSHRLHLGQFLCNVIPRASPILPYWRGNSINLSEPLLPCYCLPSIKPGWKNQWALFNGTLERSCSQISTAFPAHVKLKSKFLFCSLHSLACSNFCLSLQPHLISCQSQPQSPDSSHTAPQTLGMLQALPSLGLRTIFYLCLEFSSPGSLHGWLLLIFQIWISRCSSQCLPHNSSLNLWFKNNIFIYYFNNIYIVYIWIFACLIIFCLLWWNVSSRRAKNMIFAMAV